MNLGVLGYYRQMILRSSDVDERDVFYMLFEHVSTLRLTPSLVSTPPPSGRRLVSISACWFYAGSG
jgi:hypothetical protein